ncbi:NADH-quinone oxidoreductase subunit L [Larsenimonas rhizosphaerae]|uniref:NADH-quinone oxidoreductase subunit L n=1 Tax=Larsenimonas rhizosphaerae TaxID=2944682 RepID=A0AA41ZI39_9GAMM|nr:NADH-quinone oxidoreductase subunit L [Larsenimonas rhizosphaerae]MCX2525121.1 NADH-quinone oxidoreductase subunit L [Larsenimonas rhizosphaerae]
MTLLPLVFICPLVGALLLAFLRGMPQRLAALIGVGSIALSALSVAVIAVTYLGGDHTPVTVTLWQWISVGDFTPRFSLYVDGLTITMLGVITGVGFLIHLFASWYMTEDLKDATGYLYTRFFAYMNLFVFSMLLLVLADNLMLLYLGWEGVGLCSYLLIGYYYRDLDNARAAFKAFIVTRVGDVFLAIGMFILYARFQTLDIQTLLALAPEAWSKGDMMAELAALMLLGGAVGKSAQLPLQTWLADAMAGPTPVSALIHAATMVTAGVYLIARTHVIFELAPMTLGLVGIVGALTLLIAGLSALAQTDIKRVLAYSTMSQIGYMFLALGVQAWDAAIFHLMIHAFFKALLFLTSGSVIIACHHEQNMFRMGGLRKPLKLAYACFLVGGSALAALPLVTAGFYSKDEILWLSFASGHEVLWAFGLMGAFLTSVYTFRMIFIVFHGEEKTKAHAPHGLAHHLPLVVLLVLSTFIGAFIHPPLAGVLPASPEGDAEGLQLVLEVVSSIVAILGLGIAAALFLGRRRLVSALVKTDIGRTGWHFLHNAFAFDQLYNMLFVKPFLAIAWLHRVDWINALVNIWPWLAKQAHRGLSASQTGRIRWYAGSITAGATIMLALLVLG